jgi:hypothetical protein
MTCIKASPVAHRTRGDLLLAHWIMQNQPVWRVEYGMLGCLYRPFFTACMPGDGQNPNPVLQPECLISRLSHASDFGHTTFLRIGMA